MNKTHKEMTCQSNLRMRLIRRIDKLIRTAEKMGFKINEAKIKYMRTGNRN